MNNSGVSYKGGGFMGDKDYYNNQGPNNPKNKKPDFSDLVMRDQGPNNMPGDSTNGSELNDNLPETPSQPSTPSTQQPQKNPQEFADQKKEEVKQTYSTSHSDRINNAYRDHYGRNAHADEISNWTGTGMGIEDIQRGLKTSFARDGEHLEGEALANLQIAQEPQPTQPVQPVQPEKDILPVRPGAPNQPTQPIETKPPTLVEHENRFAASNAFRDQLEEAKNLGQTPAPQTPAVTPAPQTPAVTPAPQTPAVTPAPQTPQIPNNNVSNTSPNPQEFADKKKEEVMQTSSTSQTPENSDSQTPETTDPQYQPFLSDTSKSLLDSSQGQIDNNEGVNIGRQRIDNMLDNSSNSFNNQLQREADMRANSPITQDVTNRYQQFSLLNDDAQRGRGDFSSFANAAIQGGRDNRAVDTAALDMDYRRGIQNMRDKAALSNFNIFGDMGRNSRENPYSWTPSQPTPKVNTPDFQQIYRDNMDNINSI